MPRPPLPVLASPRRRALAALFLASGTQPSLASVAASLATIPADNCFIR